MQNYNNFGYEIQIQIIKNITVILILSSFKCIYKLTKILKSLC